MVISVKFANIIHSTGNGKQIDFKDEHYHQFPFIDNMLYAYAAADIVMSRAGLSTISELSALHKPSIIVPMPNSDEKCLGGHAVVVIGYDDNFKTGLFSHKEPHYEVRNSWGTEWGDHGHFWIPAKYIEDTLFGTDAWTIRD